MKQSKVDLLCEYDFDVVGVHSKFHMQLPSAVVPNTNSYVPTDYVYQPLGGATMPPIVTMAPTNTSVVRLCSKGDA